MLHWLAAARAAVVPPAGPSGGLLVDLGCGAGLLAPHLAGKGYRHVGVDITASAETTAQTGVEMEALTAASVALFLTSSFLFFSSFLALVLRKELDERLDAAAADPEWADIVRDLDRVEEVTVDQGTKRFVLRVQAPGCAGVVCKAVGVALSPLVRQLPAAHQPQPAPPPTRRGRPHRGATRPGVS